MKKCPEEVARWRSDSKLARNESMFSKFATIFCVALAGLWLSACDVDKTQEGEMPDVDVDAEGGQVPKYEIEQTQEGKMPDVDVDVEAGSMPSFDVTTPDVDINVDKKTIEIPDVDVNVTTPAPDDDIDIDVDVNEQPEQKAMP